MNHFTSRFLLVLGACLGLFSSSCERDADVEVPETEPKLSLTSWITSGEDTVRVFLSRSVPTFSEFNGTIQDWPDADVRVSDGTNTVQLQFDPLNLYYVGSFEDSPLEIGRTYQYTVLVDGKNLSAATRIPPLAATTSSLEASYTPPLPNDLFGTGVINTLAQLNDPDPNEFNYYRVVFELEEQWMETSAIMDTRDVFLNDAELVNGQVSVRSALQANTFGSPTQTIRTRVITASREYYEFHRTARLAEFSDNPFAEPVIVYSNVIGGLGAVGGYRQTVTEIPFVR
jgi:hypothetical protein